MYGLSFWLVRQVAGEIEIGEDGAQGADSIEAGAGIVLAIFGAAAVSSLIGNIQKRILRQRIQKRKSDFLQLNPNNCNS